MQVIKAKTNYIAKTRLVDGHEHAIEKLADGTYATSEARGVAAKAHTHGVIVDSDGTVRVLMNAGHTHDAADLSDDRDATIAEYSKSFDAHAAEHGYEAAAEFAKRSAPWGAAWLATNAEQVTKAQTVRVEKVNSGADPVAFLKKADAKVDLAWDRLNAYVAKRAAEKGEKSVETMMGILGLDDDAEYWKLYGAWKSANEAGFDLVTKVASSHDAEIEKVGEAITKSVEEFAVRHNVSIEAATSRLEALSSEFRGLQKRQEELAVAKRDAIETTNRAVRAHRAEKLAATQAPVEKHADKPPAERAMMLYGEQLAVKWKCDVANAIGRAVEENEPTMTALVESYRAEKHR